MPITEGWNTLKYDFFDFGFTIKAHQWTTIWRFLLTNSMPQCSDIFFRFAYRKDKLRKNIIYAKNYVRILFCRPPYGEDNDRGFSQLVEYTGGSGYLLPLPGLHFVFCALCVCILCFIFCIFIFCIFCFVFCVLYFVFCVLYFFCILYQLIGKIGQIGWCIAQLLFGRDWWWLWCRWW